MEIFFLTILYLLNLSSYVKKEGLIFFANVIVNRVPISMIFYALSATRYHVASNNPVVKSNNYALADIGYLIIGYLR